MPEATLLLQPGKTYAIKVRGINGPSKGEWSDPIYVTIDTDTTSPGQPTGLTATAVAGGVRLRWTNPADADLEYARVYVSDSTIPLDANGRVSGVNPLASVDTDMVVILGLNPGTWYARVEVVDHAGNRSPASGEVSIGVGQAAIPDHSDTGGTDSDGEARTKINQILAVLRTYGLIQS